MMMLGNENDDDDSILMHIFKWFCYFAILSSSVDFHSILIKKVSFNFCCIHYAMLTQHLFLLSLCRLSQVVKRKAVVAAA